MIFMSSQYNTSTRKTVDTGRIFVSRRKRKDSDSEMPITCLEDLQRVANATLKAAMADERSKRWTKVVKNYRRLLRMLHKENLPPDFELPAWYRMLMYESHYHLGLALQNIGENKRAVQQYTKAVEAVFILKNGCAAGCTSNSCLMTPLYTRRAFAFCTIGDLKNGLKDAEKAVVLDSKNPDVYCVRALVRSTRNEEQQALQDVGVALTHNPKHLCSLILRGSLDQPLASDDIFATEKVRNEDHFLASSINPDCHNFLHVNDFTHPDILTFYERFLYSLNVPHTISDLSLVSPASGAPAASRTTLASRENISSGFKSPSHESITTIGSKHSSFRSPSHESVTTMGTNPMKFKQNIFLLSGGSKPFKCGMQKQDYCDPKTIMLRRKQYGQAIRDHMQRPKTADDYLAHLEKERLKKKIEVSRQERAQSAIEKEVRRNTPKPYKTKPPSTGDPELDRIAAKLRTHNTSDGRRTRTTQTVISTPESFAPPPRPKINAKVFMEVNVEDAPRMYYRPWHGDKLPVADKPVFTCITPVFKV